MDIATLVGILGAFGIVIVAILIGGDTSPLIFLTPPSLLIVIGGTCMVVMMKFSLKQSIGAFKVASRAFTTKNESAPDLIDQIIETSQLARKNGLLALEEVETKNEFLGRGFQLLTDGTEPEALRDILTKDIEQTIDRHKWGAKVFTAAGDVAPAMGMIGTLIGLVQMLSNMADPQSIGPAMAVALLTTLYGAMLANMVCLPIADKLTLRKEEEGNIKALCLDGVLAIQSGQNSRMVEKLLKMYLTPKDRDSAPADKAAAKGGKKAPPGKAKAAANSPQKKAA
jgi:chemotaxis protein MotA